MFEKLFGLKTKLPKLQAKKPHEKQPRKKFWDHFETVTPDSQKESAFTRLTDTPDETRFFHPRDIHENMNPATLAYLPVLGLLAFFPAKYSPFVRYHLNQGILLSIVSVVWWIVEILLTRFFNKMLLYFLSILLGLLNLIILYLIFFGMTGASTGRARELPLIGRFRILK